MELHFQFRDPIGINLKTNFPVSSFFIEVLRFFLLFRFDLQTRTGDKTLADVVLCVCPQHFVRLTQGDCGLIGFNIVCAQSFYHVAESTPYRYDVTVCLAICEIAPLHYCTDWV